MSIEKAETDTPSHSIQKSFDTVGTLAKAVSIPLLQCETLTAALSPSDVRTLHALARRDQASYAQLEAMVFRLAQTQPIALLEGLNYARGKVAKRRDRHCMRAETYEDRELSAPNGWLRAISYEKKWRYRWQADREREIIAVLEGWEREVKGRAEELMWEGIQGGEKGWSGEDGYSDIWMRRELELMEQRDHIEDMPG